MRLKDNIQYVFYSPVFDLIYIVTYTIPSLFPWIKNLRQINYENTVNWENKISYEVEIKTDLFLGRL